MKELIEKYDNLNEAIAKKFCELMEYSDYHKISDGIYDFNEYYTWSVEDIIEVLRHVDDEKHFEFIRPIVEEWYDFVMECMQCDLNYVNLHSWLMGFYKTEDYTEMKASVDRITKLKTELMSLVEETQSKHGKPNNKYPKRFQDVKSKD